MYPGFTIDTKFFATKVLLFSFLIKISFDPVITTHVTAY